MPHDPLKKLIEDFERDGERAREMGLLPDDGAQRRLAEKAEFWSLRSRDVAEGDEHGNLTPCCLAGVHREDRRARSQKRAIP
jgi:hypothetical protein